MTAYNAKHPYEPDWQIPRGVWAKCIIECIVWGVLSIHSIIHNARLVVLWIVWWFF